MLILELTKSNTALSITNKEDFTKFNKYLSLQTGESYPKDLFERVGSQLVLSFKTSYITKKYDIEVEYKLSWTTADKVNKDINILKTNDYRYYLDAKDFNS